MAIYRSSDFLRVLELRKKVDNVDSEVIKELDEIAHRSGYKDRYELLNKTDEIEQSLQKAIESLKVIPQFVKKAADSLIVLPQYLKASLATTFKNMPSELIDDLNTLDTEELFEKYPRLEIEDTLAKIESHPEWLIELSEIPEVKTFIGERLVEQLIGNNDNPTQESRMSKLDDDQITNHSLSNGYQNSIKDILEACVDWVGRPGFISITVDEFLSTRFGLENGYLTVTMNTFYRKYLPEAQKLGLIRKNKNGKYSLVAKDLKEAHKIIEKLFE
jgi:hypothetical protein